MPVPIFKWICEGGPNDRSLYVGTLLVAKLIFYHDETPAFHIEEAAFAGALFDVGYEASIWQKYPMGFATDNVEEVMRRTESLYRTVWQGMELSMKSDDVICSLEVHESPELLTLSQDEKARGIILGKNGTIGRGGYEYVVKLFKQPSSEGLNGTNIAFLEVGHPSEGNTRFVLLNFSFGHWNRQSLPYSPYHLLARTVDKLTDYYSREK